MDGGNLVFDSEFMKWIATLGVGGILAAFMFHFYRKDVQRYTDLWKGQSEMLVQVVKENTVANTKLVTLIDALHRRLDDESFELHSRKQGRPS